MAAVLKTARGFAAPPGFESLALRSHQCFGVLTCCYAVLLRSCWVSPSLIQSRRRSVFGGVSGGSLEVVGATVGGCRPVGRRRSGVEPARGHEGLAGVTKRQPAETSGQRSGLDDTDGRASAP